MAGFNHEELKVYFRDRIVEFREATLSISCTGFLYGLGIFTGIRAHLNEKTSRLYIFRPDAHYARLVASCKLCQYNGFLANYSYEKFLKILIDLIKVNNMHQDVYIRVTNFTDENRISPKFVGYKDSLSAYLYPLGDYVPTTGMKCKVSSWTRIDDNAIPARAKLCGAYINTAFAKTEALQAGYDEAIVLDRNGHVVEGSAENIFLVLNGTLVTPPVSDNILEGITRDTVLTIAQDLGIKTIERSVDRTELYKADEIFLTGTGARVCGVVNVDGISIGEGGIGPVCRRIQEIYFKAIKGDLPQYKSWVVEVV